MTPQASPPDGPTIAIVPFAPRHAAAFRDLNAAWINEHFRLEPKDLETLDDPQRAILDQGGAILVAEDPAGVPVGCCALIPHGTDGTLELAKMAVAPTHRGRGVGRALIAHAVAHAKAAGAPRLFLESNTKLAPALRLYAATGFRPVPGWSPGESPYARCDIAMELELGRGG